MHSSLIEFCRIRSRGTPFQRASEAAENAPRISPSRSFPRDFQRPANSETSRIYATSPNGTGRTVDEHDLLRSPAIEEALCQAHKMETMSQMAGGLAHSFNNLLQGVMSAMNLMHGRLQQPDTGELDFLIGHAFTSVRGMGALTQRLFDFARPRRPDPKPLEINATISGMQDLLRCAMLPHFDLNLALGAGPMLTVCDRHMLENTILDLVLNAREAMPGGGTLTIKTEYADLAIEQMGLHCGRYVSICVGDTGIGMPPEVLAQAFDPFFTTKSTGHRVGLGLPLAELFAERFEGHIGIESIVGQGTRVWLCLPCIESE
jgi:signal transduction histidine kinase